jgi:hypothetical protein
MQLYQSLIRLLKGVPVVAVGAEAGPFTTLDFLQQLFNCKVECVGDALGYGRSKRHRHQL